MAERTRLVTIDSRDTKSIPGVIGTIDFENGLIVNGKSKIDNSAVDTRYQEELEGTVKLAFKGTTNFSFNLPFALNICPQGESAGTFKVQIVNIGYTFYVKGLLKMIQQNGVLSCWLSAATAMLSWINNKSFSLKQTLEFLGKEFEGYQPSQGMGLFKDGVMLMIQRMGLHLLTYTPECSREIRELLQKHGPIFATYPRSINGHAGNVYHSIIIVGILDKGVNSESTLYILDPLEGESEINVHDFLSLYNLPPTKDNESRLMHYPNSLNLESEFTGEGKGSFSLNGSALIDMDFNGFKLPDFNNKDCYPLDFEFKIFKDDITLNVEQYGNFTGEVNIEE